MNNNVKALLEQFKKDFIKEMKGYDNERKKINEEVSKLNTGVVELTKAFNKLMEKEEKGDNLTKEDIEGLIGRVESYKKSFEKDEINKIKEKYDSLWEKAKKYVLTTAENVRKISDRAYNEFDKKILEPKNGYCRVVDLISDSKMKSENKFDSCKERLDKILSLLKEEEKYINYKEEKEEKKAKDSDKAKGLYENFIENMKKKGNIDIDEIRKEVGKETGDKIVDRDNFLSQHERNLEDKMSDYDEKRKLISKEAETFRKETNSFVRMFNGLVEKVRKLNKANDKLGEIKQSIKELKEQVKAHIKDIDKIKNDFGSLNTSVKIDMIKEVESVRKDSDVINEPKAFTDFMENVVKRKDGVVTGVKTSLRRDINNIEKALDSDGKQLDKLVSLLDKENLIVEEFEKKKKDREEQKQKEKEEATLRLERLKKELTGTGKENLKKENDDKENEHEKEREEGEEEKEVEAEKVDEEEKDKEKEETKTKVEKYDDKENEHEKEGKEGEAKLEGEEEKEVEAEKVDEEEKDKEKEETKTKVEKYDDKENEHEKEGKEGEAKLEGEEEKEVEAEKVDEEEKDKEKEETKTKVEKYDDKENEHEKEREEGEEEKEVEAEKVDEEEKDKEKEETKTKVEKYDDKENEHEKEREEGEEGEEAKVEGEEGEEEENIEEIDSDIHKRLAALKDENSIIILGPEAVVHLANCGLASNRNLMGKLLKKGYGFVECASSTKGDDSNEIGDIVFIGKASDFARLIIDSCEEAVVNKQNEIEITDENRDLISSILSIECRGIVNEKGEDFSWTGYYKGENDKGEEIWGSRYSEEERKHFYEQYCEFMGKQENKKLVERMEEASKEFEHKAKTILNGGDIKNIKPGFESN